MRRLKHENPSKRESISVSASGSTYVAPSNGYVWVDAITSNVQVISIEPMDSLGSVTMKAVCYSPVANAEISAICPVNKGQSFKIFYNTGSAPSAIFIYAVGSESEGPVNSGGGIND